MERYTKLIESMRAIADKDIKHYKADFDGTNEYSDVNMLKDIMLNHQPHYERFMVWGVRDTGTDLGFKSSLVIDNSWIVACINSKANSKWYELDLDNGTLKSIKDIITYYNETRKSDKTRYSLLNDFINGKYQEVYRKELNSYMFLFKGFYENREDIETESKEIADIFRLCNFMVTEKTWITRKSYCISA